MVSAMVNDRGDWDWDRLTDMLPVAVLERLAACPTPNPRYGEDAPGWRWDDNMQFTVGSAYGYLTDGGWRIGNILLMWNEFVSIWRRPRRVLYVMTTMRMLIIFSGIVLRRLLWKRRCCLLFDADFSEREVVFEKGNRLCAESERMVGLGELTQAAEPRCRLDWRDWEVVVRHAHRERNGVTNSLAAMGRDYGMQGAIFSMPLEALAVRIEDERRSWVAMREACCEIAVGIDSGG
ncbi:hypothetical protein V6N12_022648 [Hibiscus sabdariffa]|uniref:RNase H type-1 domain-containing protein n=1 Tax=Hibiscus sabdariffa TaxID=183260 RepID=A0ABR2FVM7_9ROSI